MSPVLPEPIVEPEADEPLAPMELPLLLGVLDELLVDGELEELEEPEVAGGVDELELEPLAPIEEVPPLLLGVLAELEVSLEPLLALGLLVEALPLGELADELLLGVPDDELLLGVLLDELLVLGVVLEPEAPMVLVDLSFGFAVDVPPALLGLELEPALEPALAPALPPEEPALWAMAKPPKASAAAAATVVRVVLIMSLYSLIHCPRGGSDGKGAGSWRRLDQRLGLPARASEWVYSGRPCRTATVTICLAQ